MPSVELAADVRVLIGFDDRAALAGVVDERQRFRARAPAAGTVDLQVRDLHAAARHLADADGLGDRLLERRALVAHVGRIDAALVAGDARELGDLRMSARRCQARTAGRSRTRPRRRPSPRQTSDFISVELGDASDCDSAVPITARRTVLWPMSVAKLTDAPACSTAVSALPMSRADDPQLPATMVVTPMRTKFSARGCSARSSAWVWTSMKPGATTSPAASIASRASDLRDRADRGDATGLDGDVGAARRRAGAVDDLAAGDQRS